MNVKEFSQKHGMKLLFSNIALLAIVIVLGMSILGRVTGPDPGVLKADDQKTVEQGGKNIQKGAGQRNRTSGQMNGVGGLRQGDTQEATESGNLTQ